MRSEPRGPHSVESKVGMWSFYMLMFKDHSECTNAAPSTIETYSLAVDQLGTSLSKE